MATNIQLHFFKGKKKGLASVIWLIKASAVYVSRKGENINIREC